MTDSLSHSFFAQAQTIADKLCQAALWSGASCYWLDEVSELVDGEWQGVRRPIGSDIYAGASGIALFLGCLYESTANEIYRSTAEGAMEYALSQADAADHDAYVGLYAGHAGVAYAALQVGEVVGSERFDEPAKLIVDGLRKRDPAKQPLDITFGIAGAIPALLDVSRRYSHDSTLGLALEYGDHLIKVAGKSDAGFSWNTLGGPEADRTRDLCGFSHGTSGIGWALLELAHATGEARFRAAAEEAFRYEQHWFDSERENWPDLRSFIGSAQRYPVAWCYGAAGIGFARLRAYELTGSEFYKSEAEAALRTTAKMLALPNNLHNYSLCHGIAGNADLFVYASQVFRDVNYLDTAYAKGAQGIQEIEKQNLKWPCGSLDGDEILGLMQGIAGVGYFYLRLHKQGSTPAITIVLPGAFGAFDKAAAKT